MRTTTRLCLVASIAAAVGLAAVPAGYAAERPGSVKIKNIRGVSSHHKDAKQNKKIKKARKRANRAHERINAVKEWNQSLSDWNTSQQSAIDTLQSTVGTIVAGVPAIVGGLEALQAALEGPVAQAFADIEDALNDIGDALNDQTTGLVGLNLARPQFGAFDLSPVNGDFEGGTGPVNGSDPPHGPDGDAINGSGIGATSTYVVDFNNDTLTPPSTRMYTVNVFPGTGVGVTARAGNAVNCALAAATCNAISAGTGNTSHVLVKIGNGAEPVDGTVFGGFSVTALAG
jgi:hypothetical protein